MPLSSADNHAAEVHSGMFEELRSHASCRSARVGAGVVDRRTSRLQATAGVTTGGLDVERYARRTRRKFAAPRSRSGEALTTTTVVPAAQLPRPAPAGRHPRGHGVDVAVERRSPAATRPTTAPAGARPRPDRWRRRSAPHGRPHRQQPRRAALAGHGDDGLGVRRASPASPRRRRAPPRDRPAADAWRGTDSRAALDSASRMIASSTATARTGIHARRGLARQHDRVGAADRRRWRRR